MKTLRQALLSSTALPTPSEPLSVGLPLGAFSWSVSIETVGVSVQAGGAGMGGADVRASAVLLASDGDGTCINVGARARLH